MLKIYGVAVDGSWAIDSVAAQAPDSIRSTPIPSILPDSSTEAGDLHVDPGSIAHTG